MSFLHAIATKRKQFEEAGDLRGLMALPKVTVFEKAAEPGGVWRSNRKTDELEDDYDSPNMYEGLWINGPKYLFEYFDYTFEEHFKEPQPVFLPRKQVLEYVLARVTQHEDIFQHVNFNTEVESLTYDHQMEQFVIESKNKAGLQTVQHFDKCIWAAGLNSKPKMIPEVLNKLGDFKGKIVHSAEMDKLGSGNVNAVKGKNILMVGDNYSAEDLALQCIKLGAEEITVLSRYCNGSTVYMGSWPGDKVDVAYYSEIAGVKDDGTGTTILLKNSRPEDYSTNEVENVSIIIFCTGYHEATSFLPDDLNPFIYDDDGGWCLEDVGLDTSTWRMKENPYSEIFGHVEPSPDLELSGENMEEKFHRRLLISNPNMMVICEFTSTPLFDIDVAAWLVLAYITGERKVPTTEELEKDHLQDLLMFMDDHNNRVIIDPNYQKAVRSYHEEHWTDDVTSEEYAKNIYELGSFEIRLLAREMSDAKYPLQIGNINELNEVGLAMLQASFLSSLSRASLEDESEEIKLWKTFRDTDPSAFRSFVTGSQPTALKGRWLEIDDEGNLPTGKTE